jgi:hypothetical protein
MITVEQFKERVTALWESQKRMAAPKKWHSGKRAGTIRKPASNILFTKQELGQWLWQQVGLNAILCPYCNLPIDIISLTLDHILPRSVGGEFSLPNMQVTCKDDNERKGNLTHEAYLALLKFMRGELSPYDQGILLTRLKAANAGSGARFFRNKQAQERKPQPPVPPPAKQPALDLLGEF